MFIGGVYLRFPKHNWEVVSRNRNPKLWFYFRTWRAQTLFRTLSFFQKLFHYQRGIVLDEFLNTSSHVSFDDCVNGAVYKYHDWILFEVGVGESVHNPVKLSLGGFLSFLHLLSLHYKKEGRKEGLCDRDHLYVVAAAGGSTRLISSCMVFLSLPNSSKPVLSSTSACFASSARCSALIFL
jgi:hypothetical protein